MELDSLKEIWKESSHPMSGPGQQEREILSILRKKSNSPIARMRRNLFAELLAVIVIYSFTISYYLMAWKGRYWSIALMLFLIAIVFLVYYLLKNRLLRKMECVRCEVKENLGRQLRTLEQYVRFYFVAGTLITPLAYFTAGLLVLYGTDHSFSLAPLPPGFLWLFAGLGLLLTWGVYYLNRWMVDRLYGRHIRKLRDLLSQLEEQN